MRARPCLTRQPLSTWSLPVSVQRFKWLSPGAPDRADAHQFRVSPDQRSGARVYALTQTALQAARISRVTFRLPRTRHRALEDAGATGVPYRGRLVARAQRCSLPRGDLSRSLPSRRLLRPARCLWFRLGDPIGARPAFCQRFRHPTARGPGVSAGLMSPCRFQPVARSQVRGRAGIHGSGSAK